MLNVMRMHRDASYAINRDECPTDLWQAATKDWDEAVELGEKHGQFLVELVDTFLSRGQFLLNRSTKAFERSDFSFERTKCRFRHFQFIKRRVQGLDRRGAIPDPARGGRALPKV